MDIYPPELMYHDGVVRLEATFTCQGKKEVLWFEVDKRYADCVVTEKIDAFLLALLPLAMATGEDVNLHHPVSQRVFFNVSRHLTTLIPTAWPEMHKVSVFPSGFVSEPTFPAGNVVATGLSAGIDSLCTLAENRSPTVPKDYRITHCVFTNVGSHGAMSEPGAKERFQGRLNNARGLAKELGLEVIVIDSNLAQVAGVNYDRTHTIKNAAAVLVLEKLIRRYFYSSGVFYRDLKVGGWDASRYDPLTLYYVSTDALDFVSSGAQYNRPEKTAIVSEFPPSYRWLNVCQAEVKNCSVCEKCVRTLLTFDLLGKVDRYQDVFDLKKYRKEKRRYACYATATRRKNTTSREIRELMTTHRYATSPSFHLYYAGYKLGFESLALGKKTITVVVEHFDASPRAKTSTLTAPGRALLRIVRKFGSGPT
jgi:hypothetical protein